MKPASLPAVAAATLAALLAAACAKTEAPAPPPRTVRTILVDGAGAAPGLSYPAEVRARYESRLAFRLGGKLIERRVEVGDRVRRGQVLARLDAQDAALNAAQAEAARALAEAEAGRYRDLHAKHFVSQAVLDAKETALKTAEAQAGVARNQAGYATLVADRDGVVLSLEAEAGQVVAAGQTVARVAEGSEREVVIAVPEGDVEKLRAAAAFEVSLNSQPGRNWAGRLRELSPAADPATRTFTARIAVAQADETLRLGASATVRGQGGAPSGLRLPLSAFVTRNDQASVWVVDPATRSVKLTKVETDGVVGNELRVKAGLQPGQRVVTAGANLLVEGQTVRLAEHAK